MASESLISLESIPSQGMSPSLPPPSNGPTSSSTMSDRSSKRLSLNIPAQGIASRKHRHSATISILPTQFRHRSPEVVPSYDPNEFLTALAAQERRVLELKEELKKAEIDLGRLQNQWAAHEATKKQNELIYHAEPLRAMTSPRKAHFESQEDTSRQTNLSDRAPYVRPKPQRKIFSGGRHTRALSLLSPASMATKGSEAQILNSKPTKESGSQNGPLTASRKKPLGHMAVGNSQGAREDILNTGKQLVGDLKEGLWTFIEDIRQATVGDEAVTGIRARQTSGAPTRSPLPARKKPPISVASLKLENKPQRPKSIIGSLPDDFSGPPRSQLDENILSLKENSVEDEGWDNWDSPPPKTSNSASYSTTALSSPRTSLSSEASKERHSSRNLEQLTWPALTKLSPSNLTKTASVLMAEWERSLSPSIEEGVDKLPSSSSTSQDGSGL